MPALIHTASPSERNSECRRHIPVESLFTRITVIPFDEPYAIVVHCLIPCWFCLFPGCDVPQLLGFVATERYVTRVRAVCHGCHTAVQQFGMHHLGAVRVQRDASRLAGSPHVATPSRDRAIAPFGEGKLAKFLAFWVVFTRRKIRGHKTNRINLHICGSVFPSVEISHSKTTQIAIFLASLACPDGAIPKGVPRRSAKKRRGLATRDAASTLPMWSIAS